MPNDERILETIPNGILGLLPTKSCTALGEKVDKYLSTWREHREHEHQHDAAFKDYHKESYIIPISNPRFGTGEAKCVINQSIRGLDLYILVDVTNWSLTYKLCGHENHMSPDDHYSDLKRVIAACGGKARRITVIMPFLYESRQHKRAARESLDCALALQELVSMGVDNIITFDAHDPRVQNSIPLRGGFESVQPTYQFIKGVLKNVKDLHIDPEHLMVISPDEGATSRAIYMSNVLGVDMGMFYKSRDYSKVVDGRNPLVAHEFLGQDLNGKDVIIIDYKTGRSGSIKKYRLELCYYRLLLESKYPNVNVISAGIYFTKDGKYKFLNFAEDVDKGAYCTQKDYDATDLQTFSIHCGIIDRLPQTFYYGY